jgi:glycosyltransferase involved in cell wall biosynthesis
MISRPLGEPKTQLERVASGWGVARSREAAEGKTPSLQAQGPGARSNAQRKNTTPPRRQAPRAEAQGYPDRPPMKLIIQIPCLNEEATLPATLADLPRRIDGIEKVELLVIDDGSGDRTVEVARENGVEHIVRLTNNKGLAAGFQAGLDACLKLGADVVVNTDADNQYQGADVTKLVAPILAGEADMVVGDRRVSQIEHFSGAKKGLQRLGSWVVRRLSGTEITDTTSGFRAYNREAALQLLVVDNFTYTLESLIQAGKMLVAVDQVQVGTNPQTRQSRLSGSTGSYVRRNGPAILRIYARYEPLRVFASAGLLVLVLAIAAWTPFLIDWVFNGDSSGHIQSLILGAVLFIAAVQLFALGVIGDLLAGQRVMTQRTFERVRRVELALGVEPSHYERGDSAR